MKAILKVLVSCFLFSMLAAGCAEDGESGPQGEEGEKGDQGEKGNTGTANVVYSEWLESELSNDFAYEEYPLVEIDTNQYSLNTTVFLLYGKTGNGVVYPLPRQINSTTYSYYIVPDFGTGLPARIMVYRDGTIPGGSVNLAHFRYVIIPGGIPAGGRTINYADMEYKEIKELFHIPD